MVMSATLHAAPFLNFFGDARPRTLDLDAASTGEADQSPRAASRCAPRFLCISLSVDTFRESKMPKHAKALSIFYLQNVGTCPNMRVGVGTGVRQVFYAPAPEPDVLEEGGSAIAC